MPTVSESRSAAPRVEVDPRAGRLLCVRRGFDGVGAAGATGVREAHHGVALAYHQRRRRLRRPRRRAGEGGGATGLAEAPRTLESGFVWARDAVFRRRHRGPRRCQRHWSLHRASWVSKKPPAVAGSAFARRPGLRARDHGGHVFGRHLGPGCIDGWMQPSGELWVSTMGTPMASPTSSFERKRHGSPRLVLPCFSEIGGWRNTAQAARSSRVCRPLSADIPETPTTAIAPRRRERTVADAGLNEGDLLWPHLIGQVNQSSQMPRTAGKAAGSLLRVEWLGRATGGAKPVANRGVEVPQFHKTYDNAFSMTLGWRGAVYVR